MLVLEYKNRNDHKIFHSSALVTAKDWNIDEAFKSMHQSIMTKIENSAGDNWVIIEVLVKHRIILEC